MVLFYRSNAFSNTSVNCLKNLHLYLNIKKNIKLNAAKRKYIKKQTEVNYFFHTNPLSKILNSCLHYQPSQEKCTVKKTLS